LLCVVCFAGKIKWFYLNESNFAGLFCNLFRISCFYYFSSLVFTFNLRAALRHKAKWIFVSEKLSKQENR
jgi:hypothetical protein